VNLNLKISLPLRVVCIQCGQDLKLEGAGPQPGMCVVKCPACGVKIRLIQGQQPPQVQMPRGMPKFQAPPPKT